MSAPAVVPHETRLVRSFPDGARVHRRGCSHAGKVVRWEWAENKTDYEWVHIAGLKPCGHCLPTLYRFKKHLLATGG